MTSPDETTATARPSVGGHPSPSALAAASAVLLLELIESGAINQDQTARALDLVSASIAARLIVVVPGARAA